MFYGVLQRSLEIASVYQELEAQLITNAVNVLMGSLTSPLEAGVKVIY